MGKGQGCKIEARLLRHLEDSAENGFPLRKGDWGSHRTSHTQTPETKSRLSPKDHPDGHRTIWRWKVVGEELPREAPRPRPTSPRAVRQNDQGPGCWPSPTLRAGGD